MRDDSDTLVGGKANRNFCNSMLTLGCTIDGYGLDSIVGVDAW